MDTLLREDMQMFWLYRYKGFSRTAARTVHTAVVLAGQLPGKDVWQQLGQQAMMVSALCSMPSQGLELLERRFAGEEAETETEEEASEPKVPAAEPEETQTEPLLCAGRSALSYSAIIFLPPPL